MAISLATKSVVCLGGVGCVAISAFGIKYFLIDKDPSISELIKSKNPEKRLLNSNSSAEAWKVAWKAYREANKTKEKDIWSIDGWKKEDSIQDENAPEAFKKGCESRILGSSNLYDAVISYCTRKTILADLVGDDPKRTLLEKVTGGNTTEWKVAWAEYKKSDTTNTNGKDAWNLSNWPSAHSQEVAPDTFMDQCETNSKVEGYDTSAKLYEQLLEYCTVKK